jgi:serine/threonine protein kinase
MQQFVQALDVLQTQHHPNVIELREVLYTERNVFLVMEYCEGGELISLVGDFEALPQAVRDRIFAQMLKGLCYLHENGVAHRDLKPDNVLLDGKRNAKLADFGFSRRVDGNLLMATPCGSPTYVAPEILLGQDYDGFKADIWSLGVVLYVLETGYYPWSARNDVQLFHQITTASYEVPDTISPEIREMIQACLQLDPEKRPSAQELQRMGALKGGKETLVRGIGIRARATTIALPRPAGILYNASLARSSVYKQHLRRTLPGSGGEAAVLPTLKPRRDLTSRIEAVSSSLW